MFSRAVWCVTLALCVMGAMAGRARSRYPLPEGFQPPIIADAGSMDYPGYLDAVEKAKGHYEDTFKGSWQNRAASVVLELSRMDSSASRHYAAALVGVLRNHGVSGLDNISPHGGTASITQEELARVTALTWNLGEFMAKEAADVNLKLGWVMIRDCPSDDGAFSAVGWGLLRLVEGGPESRDPVHRRAVKAQIDALLGRVFNERRAMNLTTVMPAIGLSNAGEFLYSYLSLIENPTGHEMSDLYESMTRSRDRASRLNVGKELRETIREQRANQQRLREAVREIDQSLKLVKEAQPFMHSFCGAINRRDAEVVKHHLRRSAADAGKLSAIMGEPQDVTTLGFTQRSYHGEIIAWLTRQGPSGKRTIELELERDTEGWHIVDVTPH